MEKVYEGNLVEIFHLSPHLYFRKADLSTRGQCNGAYIVGDAGVGVVDAPPGAAEEILDEVKRLFDLPVKYLFVTHGHRDHYFGAPLFLDMDITVFCSRRLLEHIDPAKESFRATFAAADGNLRVCLPGSVDVELVSTLDVMHSKWDMFVRLEGGDYVCTGDSVVDYPATFYHASDIVSWISSLRKLEFQRGKYLLPGHGDRPLPWSYVGEFADFLSAVERCARGCMALHHPDPKLNEKERFADVSADVVRTLTE